MHASTISKCNTCYYIKWMRKRVCSVQFNIQQHCEEGLVKPKYLQNEITLSELNFEFILKVFWDSLRSSNLQWFLFTAWIFFYIVSKLPLLIKHFHLVFLFKFSFTETENLHASRVRQRTIDSIENKVQH